MTATWAGVLVEEVEPPVLGLLMVVGAGATAELTPKLSVKGRFAAPVLLTTAPFGIETFTVPLPLKLPLRLNFTVWLSIQVRLVAFAGLTTFRPVPERTRSVALTDEGLTLLEKSTVIDVGALWVEKTAPPAY